MNEMKLLIIEDDINLAATLSRRLTKLGYECKVAHNCTDALDIANAFLPSHVLLDMKLDQDNGLTLIAPLRRCLFGAQIVLLTGFASIASAVEAMRLGADDYLTKPVDMASLSQALTGVKSSSVPTQMIQNKVMSPERLEWEHIQQVLQSNHGNISVTARKLNMHRRTLQRKLQKKPVQQ